MSSSFTANNEQAMRREHKKQKREYKDEKKRVTQELLATLHDPTIVVMADWLKVRGTLRKWNRYFCVLKPGLMLIYKSNKTEKQGYWVGTVLLTSCELIERPSKKDGFCFKLFHAMDQSIWATRGPLGESHGAVTLQPLPTSYLICRAPSEQVGGCWMDALQLTLRCSGLLMRTMCGLSDPLLKENEVSTELCTKFEEEVFSDAIEDNILSEIEAEKHFDALNDENNHANSDSDSLTIELEEESNYEMSLPEQFGILMDSTQTEDMEDENKSIMWSLLKQVRPGMNLSKVTLPTFILEPRSFLEKLADFYYHSYIITEASGLENPLERMKTIVKFYLSGFYKKSKGLKKPYNPILGETFRCKWEHQDGSTTFYIAEQVSHHPPISSLFLSNRKGNFNISGTILAESKYYGNSISAMMIGDIKISLLNRGETYIASLPYANCKGIMIGSLLVEYGGQVKIECNRTDYVCYLHFKLKPFIGGTMNSVTGVIKRGEESLVHIEGVWDGEIYITEMGVKSLLWSPTKEVIMQRLKRFEIPLEEQGEWESKRLWLKVSNAIKNDDQKAATVEKGKLEDDQRARALASASHKPKLFEQDPLIRSFEYIHSDYQPWDDNNDVRQIEHDYVIKTLTKHGAKEHCNVHISSIPLVQEHFDDSDSGTDKPLQLKKKHLAGMDSDRLQNIQETLDRSIDFMRHMERRMEAKPGITFTNFQLIIAVTVFALFQALFLPVIVGSRCA